MSTERENDASRAASARAAAACWARRAARSTTSATSTATSTMATSVITFSSSAMVNVYSGGVRKKLSSKAPPNAASSAGPSPPTSATTTVARKNSTTSVDSPTSSRPSVPTAVASSGRATASAQPSAWRRIGTALDSRGSRRPRPASAWLTMCTSMCPESCTTRAPMPSTTDRATRDRREVPSTSWVASTPRAKSSSAAGTSSPTTVWKDAPTSSASLRSPASAPTGAPTRPSPRSTCTANSSAEPERLAMRAARRSTVSLSGPPVRATTTRSRVSQMSVTRWSVR